MVVRGGPRAGQPAGTAAGKLEASHAPTACLQELLLSQGMGPSPGCHWCQGTLWLPLYWQLQLPQLTSLMVCPNAWTCMSLLLSAMCCMCCASMRRDACTDKHVWALQNYTLRLCCASLQFWAHAHSCSKRALVRVAKSERCPGLSSLQEVIANEPACNAEHTA